MKATLEFVKNKFDEYNKLIFNSVLPDLPILLGSSKSYLGQLLYRRKISFFLKTQYTDFRLRISTRIDLPQSVLEDIIIHEMIHYYIAYNNIKDTSSHGEYFKKMMSEINSKYSRNISISHKISKDQHEALMTDKIKQHWIAIVSFIDGRVGFKVLPHTQYSKNRYYNSLRHNKAVKEVSFYKSDNPFFNKYPSSSASYVYFQNIETVYQLLQIH